MITYTDPKLCTYDMDITKAWFVYFTVTNDITGEEKPCQFRGGINYIKNKEKRLFAGNALRKYWKERLQQGLYNPFRTKKVIAELQAPVEVVAAIDKIIELKKSSLKPKSIRNYNDVSGMFKKWLNDNGFSKLKLQNLSNELAQSYLDYLLLQRNYSGKSYNNQKSILHALFGEMNKKSRKWITENPFSGIAELPEDVGNNLAYTEQEAKQLIEYFKQHDKRMYYAVNFIFHGFIRKTELCNIRVGDIDWINFSIKLKGGETKNRFQDSVTITEGWLKVLYEMGLDMAPKGFYIFGKGMQTCELKCTRPDNISDRHLELKKALIKELGNKTTLKINDGKAYYSFKHSGVIAYWKVVKDVYFLMRQLRHSDMKTTMIYMKSLGLLPNEPFRKARIEL